MKKNTQLILQQTKDIYNRIAPDFSNTRFRWWHGFGDFAKYVRPGDRVIDIGCGNGRMAEVFFGSKVEYLGIDNSAGLIEIARERFKDLPWANFEVGDLLDENFGTEKGSYNLALMIAVLHHIPGRKLQLTALRNIWRILKPDGRLIMYNWNLFEKKQLGLYWKYIFNYKLKVGQYGVWSARDAFVPWKLKDNWQMRYVHSFSKRELKHLLNDAGFIIDYISYERVKGGSASFWHGQNLVVIARKK